MASTSLDRFTSIDSTSVIVNGSINNAQLGAAETEVAGNRISGSREDNQRLSVSFPVPLDEEGNVGERKNSNGKFFVRPRDGTGNELLLVRSETVE